MKINVISLNNGHSLTEDAETLAYTIKKLYRKKKIHFNYFSFRETKGTPADVNIFIGIINYSLFKYAPINIMIIDTHKFHRNWISCLKKMDYIITKTEYSSDLLAQYTEKEKIYNLGWKNKDYLDTSVTKDYDSFLAIMGHSSFRQIEKILNLWKEEYPKLTILAGKNYFKNKEIEKKEQENIEYIEEYLPSDKFVKLINEKGLHLCLSSTTTFCNTLHICQSVKSIPVTLNCILYNKYVTNNIDGFLVKHKKKSKMKYTLGSEYKLDDDDFQSNIEKIMKIQKEDEILLEEMTDRNKKNIRKDEMEFDKKFKTFFDMIWEKHYSIDKIEPTIEIYEDEFPEVTIITPTYNKRKFMKLAIRNFQKTDYPQDKIEWIIVDDGEEEIKDLLPEDKRIKYIKLNEKKSIGEKRNIACENAKGEYIVCMDDDEYYTPESVKYRVASLIHLNKNVVACSSLGLFDINKLISNVNISSYSVKYYHRIFEHTMGFRKSHWEKYKFDNTSLLESFNLIKNDINDYEDIYWEKIGISLKHYNNTNNRMEIQGNTNGSHFNINDEVFELITNIEESDDSDKEMIQKHKDELKEREEENIRKEKEFEHSINNSN